MTSIKLYSIIKDMRKAIAPHARVCDRLSLTHYSESIMIMAQERENPEHPQSVPQSFPKRERIKHLLIGSPKAVTSTIHYLQAVGYANVGDWSPLLSTDNPDEVMSILIRQILTA
ncbi:hypothetical protein H6G77_04280 [Aulosira sp. FACHB-615]|nr:hypothetical protein [Aulosira sp. FACHB-615]